MEQQPQHTPIQAPIYPYPKPKVPVDAHAPHLHLYHKLQTFFQNRSYRRVLLIAGAGGVIFAAWYAYQQLIDLSERPRLVSSAVKVDNNNVEESKVQEKKIVEDKVVIHCSPRGFFTPSIATAPLQLETFLRVAGIPYEVNFYSEEYGYEAPFMTYGQKVGYDFRECVKILSEKFEVNLEKDVSSSRKTASHLVDISLENQFAWAILIWRWIHDEGNSMRLIQAINALGEEVVGEVAQRVKEATRYHPIGQLDREDFVKTINQAIHDISAALGRHKFFQGTTPGTVDCHAFAILVQMLWNMPNSPFEHQLRKYTNLVDFIRRMRDTYWPDWKELILKPKEYEELCAITMPLRSRSMSREDRFKKRKSPSTSRGPIIEKSDDHDEESSAETDTQQKPHAQNSPHSSHSRPRRGESEGNGIKVIVKKDGVDKDPSEEIAQSADSSSQPIGILKSGNLNNNNILPNTTTSKPRSGLVLASDGQHHFPLQHLSQSSDAVSSSANSSPNSAPSPPGELLKAQSQESEPPSQDSMLHVHKPSVKFAAAPSTEYNVAQNLANGNDLSSLPLSFPSMIPVRKAPSPPQVSPSSGSPLELSKMPSPQTQSVRGPGQIQLEAGSHQLHSYLTKQDGFQNQSPTQRPSPPQMQGQGQPQVFGSNYPSQGQGQRTPGQMQQGQSSRTFARPPYFAQTGPIRPQAPQSPSPPLLPPFPHSQGQNQANNNNGPPPQTSMFNSNPYSNSYSNSTGSGSQQPQQQYNQTSPSAPPPPQSQRYQHQQAPPQQYASSGHQQPQNPNPQYNPQARQSQFYGQPQAPQHPQSYGRNWTSSNQGYLQVPPPPASPPNPYQYGQGQGWAQQGQSGLYDPRLGPQGKQQYEPYFGPAGVQEGYTFNGNPVAYAAEQIDAPNLHRFY